MFIFLHLKLTFYYSGSKYDAIWYWLLCYYMYIMINQIINNVAVSNILTSVQVYMKICISKRPTILRWLIGACKFGANGFGTKLFWQLTFEVVSSRRSASEEVTLS